MSRPRAYVVHQPVKLDYTTRQWVPNVDVSFASVYGDVVFLLTTPERAPVDPELTLPILREKLKAFTKDDYLVLVGDMNLVIYAAALAMKETGGFIRMLRWNPVDRGYICITANVYDGAASIIKDAIESKIPDRKLPEREEPEAEVIRTRSSPYS